MSAEPVTSAAVSAWSLLQKAEVLAQLDSPFPFFFSVATLQLGWIQVLTQKARGTFPQCL